MKKEEKKRRFESEALILPPLKMILVENDQDKAPPASERASRVDKYDVTEETVLKIIGKISSKE